VEGKRVLEDGGVAVEGDLDAISGGRAQSRVDSPSVATIRVVHAACHAELVVCSSLLVPHLDLLAKAPRSRRVESVLPPSRDRVTVPLYVPGSHLMV
jgi:hypothetical protein